MIISRSVAKTLAAPFFAAALVCLLSLPAPAQSQDQSQDQNQTTDESMVAHNEAPEQEMTEQEKLHLKMHTEFAEFARAWVDKLNGQPNFNPDGAQVSAGDNGFTVRYHQLQYRSAVVRESVTMPGNFSGLLRYWDVLLECSGTTENEAKAGGNCERVEGTAQAYCEIFQFKNGKWF